MPANPETLLDALDPEQRRVAEAVRGPVRVLAGAGTGKTRAITHRIAYGVATGRYQPTEMLAVTFTTRAAGEMRTRLRALGAPGVQARTFHSAALRQLRYFWPAIHGADLPTLTQSKIPLIALAARRERMSIDQGQLRDLASEIEWAKVSNVTPDRYVGLASAGGREVGGIDGATVARILNGYEELKREQGRMDMEDVLLLTAAMLAQDERVAAQIRRQYKFFTVDEFQDVSPIQSALLDLWLGGRDEVCVVGDPAQTIYSFAGADASYLRDFPAKFAGVTSVDLVRNYRSTPQVIGAANSLLARSSSAGVDLAAQRRDGRAVHFTEHADEIAEAAAVANEIVQLRDSGTALSEIAVLFRINAQSEAFEEALAEKGVGYVVRGAARFFDRPEVRQAVTLLRGSARAGESAGAEHLVESVRATLAGMGWSPTAPSTRGATRDRWESLQAMVTLAESFAESEQQGLAEFVGDLDRRAAEQQAPVAEGVTLATIHTAKGLEWDAVFVTGAQEGSLPISMASTPAEIEEERRLLYVAMTRARDLLSISWSQARNPGGRRTRRPSRFLDGMSPATSGGGAGAPGSRPTKKRPAKVARCRNCHLVLETAAQRKLGRCPDCPATFDEALLDELKQWRRARASEDEVPAYVVFTDATLEAVAEARPRSVEALLRVSGVGQAKLEKYGDAVLAMVSARAE